MMKELISLGLVCVCGISLLTACSENDGNKTRALINTSSKIKEKAESTEFIAKVIIKSVKIFLKVTIMLF